MKTNLEIAEQEYKDLFKWLYNIQDIELEKELDISMAHSYNEPYIYYPKEIGNIFRTKAMQRLQKVNQLSLSTKKRKDVYHTRLEHCKGAYRRSAEFIAFRFRDKNWREYIEDNNLKQYLLDTMIFMATHDIGHFMLSHAMESKIGDENCNHELIGDKILKDNKEISEVIGQARKTDNKTNSKHTELQSFCEGNIDFDRQDFIFRDSLYLGTQEDPMIATRINSRCNLVKTIIDNKEKYVYAYKESVVKDILTLLEIRNNQYKTEYRSIKRRMTDFMDSFLAEYILEHDIDSASKLKQYLSKFIGKPREEIDTDEYIKGNDLFWCNNIINIARNMNNGNIRRLITLCIPSEENLINMAINMLDPKNSKQEDYDDTDIEYIDNVRRIINENQQNTEFSRLLNNKKDQCLAVELYSEEELEKETEKIKSILGDKEVQGLKALKIKHTKYKKGEPIYIEKEDGSICTLDEYEGVQDKLEDEYTYGIYVVKPILLEEGIEEEKIDTIMSNLRKYKAGEQETKSKVSMSIFKTENISNMGLFDR